MGWSNCSGHATILHFLGGGMVQMCRVLAYAFYGKVRRVYETALLWILCKSVILSVLQTCVPVWTCCAAQLPGKDERREKGEKKGGGGRGNHSHPSLFPWAPFSFFCGVCGWFCPFSFFLFFFFAILCVVCVCVCSKSMMEMYSAYLDCTFCFGDMIWPDHMPSVRST